METDFSNLSKVQKLGALLILLGPETAAQLLKGLDEAEIEAITSEMAKIGYLTQETQQAVLREFTQLAVDASTSVTGGIDMTQTALERALGPSKASHLVNRLASGRAAVPALRRITELESSQLYNLVRLEQPQMIALVLSFLAADKASEVLALLGPKLSEEVVERLATLAPTPVEVVEKLVEVLTGKLGDRPTRPPQQTGGLKTAADLLNALDKKMSKVLLMSIEERNPELGQAIRQKMFTFDDIATLDVASLQKVLREVDTRDLAASLKNASEKLKGALLGAISKRAAETVREEIGLMGTVKARDIETAQKRIIEVIRRLEAEGEIELGEANSTKNEVNA